MKRESFSYHCSCDLPMFQCSLSARSLFATCAVVFHTSWSWLQATIFCGPIQNAIRYDVCGKQQKLLALVVMRAVQWTDIMRFLTCYVHVTKCPSDTKYEQNPNQTVLKSSRLQGTPYDTLWCLYKAAWILLCSCIGLVYVEGKVVQFIDIMRFKTYYVNVTNCLPDTKYKQNSLNKQSWISLYSSAGHIWLSVILKSITFYSVHSFRENWKPLYVEQFSNDCRN